MAEDHNDQYLPLGPVEDIPYVDNFTYEDVKEGTCTAQKSREIGRHLLAKAHAENVKYLCVCVPCYNEGLEELLKTLISLMENFDFMIKKARLHDDNAGKVLKEEFNATRPVIVPIFDGVSAMSKSMKSWLVANFPGILDDLTDGPSAAGKTDVRVYCSKWWYYADDVMPLETGDNQQTRRSNSAGHRNHSKETAFNAGRTSHIDDETLSRLVINHRTLNPDGSFRASFQSNGMFSANFSSDNMSYFHMVPIVKRQNHRKHNSHQWFFDSICQALDQRVSYAFLTDCGTTYNATCLARLLYELYFKTDLIGVTARQRVETPNLYFHPCEDAPYRWMQGDHEVDARPCWKCYLTFLCSPCPLQGFEFEATLIMNSAMFNLVEALPVMPGPCQLLHWQKMKKFKVVDEYFNLLFKGEAEKKLPRLPRKFKRMKSGKEINDTSDKIPESGGSSSKSATSNSQNSSSQVVVRNGEDHVVGAAEGKITFTEFLRVNMRLAEDRILSFVCVFSTGYGTKWIPGATFFYQPEIQWNTLLTQRRRWLNGTFASFLFFFNSQRASTRILGGMFDSHKAGKNVRFVNALWSLQLFQLVLVLIAPAVFGSAGYIGLLDSAKTLPQAFGWANYHIYGPIISADLWAGLYLGSYAIWTLRAYNVPRGKIPEYVCQMLVVGGALFIFPVYFAVWYTIFTQGVDVVDGLVICSLLLPIVIALAQSATSAFLYVLYLPWFLSCIVFFLVFIPAYSFARLWDTTWGNRATGKDSAINEKVENTMKFRNWVFIVCLVFTNIALTFGFVRLFRFGYNYVLSFMFIVFCPMIIQLICSFLFLFIVIPLRNLTARPEEDESAAKSYNDDGVIRASSQQQQQNNMNPLHNNTSRPASTHTPFAQQNDDELKYDTNITGANYTPQVVHPNQHIVIPRPRTNSSSRHSANNVQFADEAARGSGGQQHPPSRRSSNRSSMNSRGSEVEFAHASPAMMAAAPAPYPNGNGVGVAYGQNNNA